MMLPPEKRRGKHGFTAFPARLRSLPFFRQLGLQLRLAVFVPGLIPHAPLGRMGPRILPERSGKARPLQGFACGKTLVRR